MKKLFLLLTIALLPMVAKGYTALVDGIYYDLDNLFGTAQVTYKYISSQNEEAYKGNVNIPLTVKYGNQTYNVTSISNYAFVYCSNLTSVTIPTSIEFIGSAAFRYCEKLTV